MLQPAQVNVKEGQEDEFLEAPLTSDSYLMV